MTYWDTSYIARLYVQDPGWQAVERLARTDKIACSLHGRAEALATFHRKLREGLLTTREFTEINRRFEEDCLAQAFQWLAVTAPIVERLRMAYLGLPATISLRASDALHLASAAESGFKEIYSNDTRLLNAASHFGLKGLNVI